MKTFSFGRNWKNYVQKAVNLQVLEEAKQTLLRYLPAEAYKNKNFYRCRLWKWIIFSFSSPIRSK